jgi:CubicO group peptidase (beta-lactamase class C family)
MAGQLPDWIVYPDDDWVQISPGEAGLDEKRFANFLASLDVGPASFGGEDHSEGKWGAMLTRGGYLIHEWGNRNYAFQTASTGKAFIWTLLGFAIEDGLLDPDEPIHHVWTGEGQLSHQHKYLNHGHHKTLTWRHLIGDRFENKHYGGFPIELGNRWRHGQARAEGWPPHHSVPEWANWTGDPFHDLYSHAKPGTVGRYSSAGFWRLGQALTAAFKRDLKEVLDERLFSKIGIPADRWDWVTGRHISADKYFYPGIPDSYTYLDPPYEIGGAVVRGGPGWVIISASDLARFGHLISTRGIWNERQIIDENWLRGHSGGNDSGVSGESDFYTAIAVVTTTGLKTHQDFGSTRKSFIPEDCFAGHPRP